MIRYALSFLAMAAVLALVGCGLELRWAVPADWWQDGGQGGPDHIVSQPLFERPRGK